MKNRTFIKIILILLLVFAPAGAAWAQDAAAAVAPPNMFKVGDRVEADSSAETKGVGKKNDFNKLVYGKYGCLSTTGSVARGTYQIHPRGSFVITAAGKYTYYGYEKPSPGTFTVDDKGLLHFKGGVFDGGEATPLGEGYENQFFLVYPTITDNRWKCKLVD
jgi:hypothetical protein